MRVFIVTEGGSEIGVGHITRCLSLCEAFEEKNIVPILIVNGDQGVEYLLQGHSFRIVNWLNNTREVLGMVSGADVAVIDSYLADVSFYRKISNIVEVPIFLDDYVRLDYPRGVVVNGMIYAEELKYKEHHGVDYLLGTRYLPLRKAFSSVPKKQIQKNVSSVMVSFGGDDSKGMTAKVLRVFDKYFPSLLTKVVIGRWFKDFSEIQSAKKDNTELIFSPSAETMRDIMLSSDLAVSAGGQTLYELARVGVPPIAVCVAWNQLGNIRGWEKVGFASIAGSWDDENLEERVRSSVEVLSDPLLREVRSNIGQELVDGQGSLRILKHSVRAYESGG